jgi:[protein-PII] uridylyltransferase
VRHHLLLSLTAQKKDIGDPAVIREFAEIVGDETHLDYLYILTVADVRATNPKLWNSWRAQLFEELEKSHAKGAAPGLENPVDKQELLTEKKAAAREILHAQHLDDATIDRTWSRLSEDYFLRCRPAEIAAHTVILADPRNIDASVLVDVRGQSNGGGTAVFLFTPQRYFTFAIATAVMDELGFSIADARIISLPDERSLSTYVVLEADGSPVSEEVRIEQLRRRLTDAIQRGPDAPLRVTRRAPRQVRMFETPTHVSFGVDKRNNRSVIELVTGDRPGLLSEVGKIFRTHRVRIETAKIVTVGERAEDVFYVTSDQNGPLSESACEALKTALTSPAEASP